jgi:hypothetical protein
MDLPSGRALTLYLALFVAMMALRQDFWFANDARLVFGFVPAGLAYQAGFSLLACFVMAALVRWAWPSGIERLEHEDRR